MVLSGICHYALNARIMTSNQVISLVPFIEGHVFRTFDWVSDPDFRHQFLMRGEPTWEGHQEYFSYILKDPTQRIFAIHAGEIHVGNCGLKNITLNDGELWIYIGDTSVRGRGIGSIAVNLLLREGFEVMGLKVISVHVADFNETALKMYKKAGFQEVLLSDSSDEWTDRGCRIIRMELRK